VVVVVIVNCSGGSDGCVCGCVSGGSLFFCLKYW
jgi:hypothetical protein